MKALAARPSFWVFFGLLAVIYAVFSLPPESAMTEAHDGLDSVTTYFLMIDQFAVSLFELDRFLDQFHGGTLPFNALAISDFHLVYAIFKVFPPFTAYILVVAVFKVVAFVGFYLLAVRHVLPQGRHREFIAAASAFCFAVFPTTFVYLGTSLSVPLFLWGFLNTLGGERRWVNWFAVLVYPLLSTLHLGGYFLYLSVGVVAMVSVLRRRPSARQVVAQVATLALVVILVERRLFYHWFLAAYDYSSSRFVLYESWLDGHYTLTLGRWAREFAGRFVAGQGAQFPDFHAPLPILVVATAIVAILLARFRGTADGGSEAAKRAGKMLVWILLGIAVISAAAVAEDNYLVLVQLFDFPFRLHRIEMIVPTLWWSAFAVSLAAFGATFPRLNFAVFGVVVLVCAHTALQFPGIKERVADQFGVPRHAGLRAAVLGAKIEPRPYWAERAGGNFSFAEYFELESFSRIKADLAAKLGLDQSAYRVLSVDLEPSVALFHGFYALDGVFADLNAKAYANFWQLFPVELQKSGMSKGHRLEVRVASSSRTPAGINLDFDVCLLWRRGGRVIFSRSDFADPKQHNLALLDTYGSVRVYLIENPECG
ncbi:MAG: hypothetical protein HQ495_15580 [Alphaproteobacteria bacterium]|nr:hypothetical protein [Alphaproteobacteria bacterium]